LINDIQKKIQLFLKVDSKPTYACNMTGFLKFNGKTYILFFYAG